VFQYQPGYTFMSVPCGGCIGCRLDHARSWAIRCVHESQMHQDNCFLTLTYDNEHIPEGGTLVKKHFQDFMKRLRFHVEPKEIRYFHCGEYGSKTFRPHYHALIFGWDFPDKRLFQVKDGNRLYTSKQLTKIWGLGHASIGAVTFQSAGYVARYITKKITGAPAQEHYERIDTETGEIIQLQPEYVTMSRRPGIGREWFNKYGSTDLHYAEDCVIIEGKRYKIPRYYDKLLEEQDPRKLEELKESRKAYANAHPEEQTPARLKAREQFKQRQAKRLVRPLE